jgi:uncharacterized protein YlxW (UPF0749 family)
LLRALRRPGSRGQVTAAVLLAIVGFASVVQVQSNDRDENFAGARQQDLIRLLDSLTLASERAEKEIAELEETRRSLITDTDSNNAALEQAREQAAALSILAGTVPAVGQGVVVSVRDPAGGVGIDQMLNGLEELRDAGAEAIEINNTVRVVAQTALEDGEGGVVIDGQQLSSPYRIEVIGEPNTLAQALDFTGGFTDEVEGEAIGGEVVVEERETVQVSTVREPNEPEYAEPSGQE